MLFNNKYIDYSSKSKRELYETWGYPNWTYPAKIPGKTGFLDLGTPSAGSGNISDGDGCLFGDADSTVDLSGATNVCTFNGSTVDGTVSGAEYVVIKISAHKNWTGYLNKITVTWSG